MTAAFPRATPNKDGGLWFPGVVDGLEAMTSFEFGPQGLAQIGIEWTTFNTMDECATTWTKLRAKYDGRFGASQSDNLAAYWNTPTASIKLACNPDDNSRGAMSMDYALPEKK